jgi:glycosyltransferase involved in cell wall biosynthesis
LKPTEEYEESRLMTTPVVTVLTSCYNGTDFLSEAIDSILMQTFTDFEFILIDDGSTDDTLEIIRSYAAKDSRVVVIEKEHTGLTDSLNFGVNIARGKWVARLDADDMSTSDRLRKQVSYMKAHPNTVLVGCGCFEVDGAGHILKQHFYPRHHKQLCRRLERNQAFFPHSASMFDRQKAGSIGGYNRRLVRSQDWDLWLRLCEMGQIACLLQPLVKLRRHSKGISHDKHGTTQIAMGHAAIICHFCRRRNAPDPSQLEEGLWRRFIDWLSFRLDQEGVFQMQQEWAELRQAWFSVPGKSMLGRGLILGKGLVKSSHGLRIVWNKVFGSNIAAKLADEWMRKA